jgi:hypothetical protein
MHECGFGFPPLKGETETAFHATEQVRKESMTAPKQKTESGDLELIQAMNRGETVSTAELTGPMGASALAVPKPSRTGASMTQPDEAALDAVLAHAGDMGERWLIELVALPDPCPAAVRVRAMLKRALRSHGLRCVLVRDPRPDEIANANEKPSSHR